MSVLFIVIALAASLASAAAAAWGMRWYIERNRIIAESEDPRDTQIRELLASMKIANEDVVKARTKELDAKEHVGMAHERINELLERVAIVEQKYVTCEETLERELADKELIDGKLKAASQQLEDLQQRAQELEMELRVSQSGDMLDPANAGGTVRIDNTDTAEEVLSEPIEDSSPSLIQCLTTEMERWKRHCRVLGDELKAQRDRLVNDEPEPAINGIQQRFDDLTDIKGIGKVLARKLHELGIYTFDQLASMTDDDLERAAMLIPDFDRRMQRDDWIGQARAMQQSDQIQQA